MMRPSAHRGFSLIEMIVAITVLGILSAAAAVFLRGPIASYFDSERRADLADAGALALAKLRLEIANAVPYSVRVATLGGRTYIEWLPLRVDAAGVPSQGRYRTGGAGDALTFGAPDTGFDVLGPAVLAQAGDWVVVNNHLPGQNVWAGSSRAAYTGPSGTVAAIAHAPHTFPADAPGHRFQIATRPVTWLCDPAAGSLRRIGNYGNPASVQPTAFGAGAQNDLLATDLRVCRAQAVPAAPAAGTSTRTQVLALELGFERAGERLNLVHTVRVGVLP